VRQIVEAKWTFYRLFQLFGAKFFTALTKVFLYLFSTYTALELVTFN